jgi:hypothetical protein
MLGISVSVKVLYLKVDKGHAGPVRATAFRWRIVLWLRLYLWRFILWRLLLAAAFLGGHAKRKARDGHQNEQKLLKSPHHNCFLSQNLTQSGKKESASLVSKASTMPKPRLRRFSGQNSWYQQKG